MNMLKIVCVALSALLAGCAGSMKSMSIPLDAKPNHVQVIEARPSWFSTQSVAVVYDEEGKIVGVTGAGGMPVIEGPLRVMGAAATVGGAYVLGNFIYKGGKAVSNISIDAAHSLDIDNSIPPSFPPGLIDKGGIPPGLLK